MYRSNIGLNEFLFRDSDPKRFVLVEFTQINTVQLNFNGGGDVETVKRAK